MLISKRRDWERFMIQAKYETVDVVLLLTRMQVKSKAMHQSPRACSINLTCSSLLATLCLNSANICT